MIVIGNTMADFCHDCCVELFGGTDIEAEQNDFFGLITKEEFDEFKNLNNEYITY